MESHKAAGSVLVFILLFALVGIIHSCAYVGSATWVGPYKVVDKERVVDGSGDSVSSRYMIYTREEVFENTDSMWFGKWNSADFYARIEEGKTYRFRVAGWRWGFLSWNRNIIEYQLVETSNDDAISND